MNRESKIRLLQAIREAKGCLQSLHPPQVYTFIESGQDPGLYEMGGKEYSVNQYIDFCEKVKIYNNYDIIISITKHLPTLLKTNLTLKIS